jgi:hypothetical protein
MISLTVSTFLNIRFAIHGLMLSEIAHENMVDNDVLHRDISWYNVLCNPRHFTDEDGKIVHDRPCINKILYDSSEIDLI